MRLQTAKDNGSFDAVLRQVKGNALETLVHKRDERTGPATNLASFKKQVKNIVSDLTRLELKPDNLSEMNGELEGLDRQSDELDTRISVLDRAIHRLERQQICRKELRCVFKEFSYISLA